MKKKLGSNPLDSLMVKGEESVNRLEPVKPRKEAEKSREESTSCIHLRKRGDNYFCTSSMAKERGFLGIRKKMEQKCAKCHVRIVK